MSFKDFQISHYTERLKTASGKEKIFLKNTLKQLTDANTTINVPDIICNGDRRAFNYLPAAQSQSKSRFENTAAIQRRTKGNVENASEKSIIEHTYLRGHSMKTLTASSEVLFIEFPWTHGKCEQYEGRVDRISQKNNVRATYLIAEKTVDEYCYFDIVLKKKTISEEVTGTSEDVEEELIDNLLNLFNQK